MNGIIRWHDMEAKEMQQMEIQVGSVHLVKKGWSGVGKRSSRWTLRGLLSHLSFLIFFLFRCLFNLFLFIPHVFFTNLFQQKGDVHRNFKIKITTTLVML